MLDRAKLAGTLRIKRREKGLSQGDLAARIGLNINTISSLENGLITSPSYVTLLRVCGFLQMPIESFHLQAENPSFEAQTA